MDLSKPSNPSARDFAALAVLALATAGCGGGSDSTEAPPAHSILVFDGENEDLNGYDPATLQKQAVVTGNEAESNPDLPALNGQICFFAGGTRAVMGDDAGQSQGVAAGWSILALEGTALGSMSAKRLVKLSPTYQASIDSPDNYGCAFLSDGRLLTTDIGNKAEGSGDGQLIVWFPPFEGTAHHYCKLDVALSVAGGIYVDEQDRIYVATARGGVIRYTGPFPTGDDAAHGCSAKDVTGAPMATGGQRETFIKLDANAMTPGAVARSKDKTFFVSSMLNGVIAEYDETGKFVRRVLQPPAGEAIGAKPMTTGSPFGLGVDSSGTLYYADIALVTTSSGIDAGADLGSVRRIRFDGDTPLAPEVLDSHLNFPDGIGVLER